jgi:hypothetical protein
MTNIKNNKKYSIYMSLAPMSMHYFMAVAAKIRV